MADLEQTLQAHGIDTSSLALFFDSSDGAIYTLKTDGSHAIELWHVLRGRVEETGYWPVVVGDQDALEQHKWALEEYKHVSVDELLRASETISGSGWLKTAYDDMFGPSEEVRDLLGEPDDEMSEEEYDDTYPRGEWPEDAVPSETFSVPYKVGWENGEATYTLLPIVYIALIPTVTSWHIPAHLKAGGWNECPEAKEHCAVFRYWRDRYGAEIVCMSDDTFEMQVSRPPETREQAIELAEEQYGYCADIVDQGVGTIEALAATLLNSKIWYFWWD